MNLIQLAKYGAEIAFGAEIALCLATLILYVARERLLSKGPKFPNPLFWRKAGLPLVNYSDLPQFTKYDVENGFLLGVQEDESIEFTVEAALTDAYSPQQKNLWREIRDAWVRDLPPHQRTPSFAKILIVFPNIRSVHWIERKMTPIVGFDGSIDYGGIDCFTIEGDKSYLSGKWGDVEIVSDPVEVKELE